MSVSENFSLENFSFWKERSEIDYIPLFVFLWFALTVWMKNPFEEETAAEEETSDKTKTFDRNRLDMLKRSGGALLGAFSRLIIAENTDGERFRAEFGELHDALAGARIRYNKDRWPNRTIDFDCCIIDWNNGDPEFESILVLEEIDDESTSNNSPAPDEMNKIELNDDLSVENDPERLFAAYMEIVYQIRCTLVHVDLDTNIEDTANKRVVRQLLFDAFNGDGGYLMQYSIVNYQSIVDSSHSLRLDAEFFHPDYLEVQQQLEAISSHRLKNFQVKIRHPKEIKRNYVDDGVLFLRAQNVRPLSIDLTSNPVYISEEDAERLRENTIHHKDILITRTGANAGQCAIYLENSDAISSSHTFIVKSGKLNPFFLAIFLNTTHGKALIERGKYGSSQPEIAPYFLYQIPMPVWNALPPVIEKTYLQSKDLTELSKTRYIEAQNLLLTELGFEDWQPKHQLTFVKNFSDTESTERIDAEYFQPKYEEIEEGIENYSKKSTTVRNEFKENKSTFEVEPDQLYRYVEIGSVNVSTGEIIAEEVLGKDLPVNAKRVLKKGDIVVSKVRTYRGAITIVQEDGYVGSGAFCILRENGQINKETLLACLRSKLFLTWSWKPNTGTSYPTLGDDDILDFPIPLLPKEKQAEIEQKVTESVNLRKRAKALLEHAKCAVEIAIEQNEQAAISYLESVVETP